MTSAREVLSGMVRYVVEAFDGGAHSRVDVVDLEHAATEWDRLIADDRTPVAYVCVPWDPPNAPITAELETVQRQLTGLRIRHDETVTDLIETKAALAEAREDTARLTRERDYARAECSRYEAALADAREDTLSHSDLCKLSVLFNRVAAQNAEWYRINEWLKRRIKDAYHAAQKAGQ